MSKHSKQYDPLAKEHQLREESASWDTAQIEQAESGDIPVLNLTDYFQSQNDEDLEVLAKELRRACIENGFYSIVGHGIDAVFIKQSFSAAQRFFGLSFEEKHKLLMDRPEWPVKAVGYLPVDNRKLPTRKNGNFNEALVIKRDDSVALQNNQWPTEDSVPGFREQVIAYAEAIETLYADNIHQRYLDLAFHYEQAENEEKTQFYLKKAADLGYRNAMYLLGLCYLNEDIVENSRLQTRR